MTSKVPVSSVKSAATLTGEFEFISAIASDLTNDASRLVYADWLEERGDVRAEYVRSLVKAMQGLGKVPALPKELEPSRVWANMLGATLIAGITDLNLGDFRDNVLRLAHPIVTITTEQVKETSIKIGESKFGGHPDLPSIMTWPTCKEGPLGFLGQIKLKDISQTQAAHSLPTDGLLAIFAYQNFSTGYQPGVFEAVKDDTQVIYIPESESLVRRNPPDDIGENGNAVLPSCRVSMSESWDLPDHKDVVPGHLVADLERLESGKRGDALHKLRSKCHRFGHHLLGYSVHFRTDDPSPGVDWVHLLCLESDDNLGWSWCDGEHLAIFVHKDELLNHQFKRVYGYAS